MTDQEFIQALVKKGLLAESSAAKVFKEAEVQGRSPEDLLYEEHLADELKVAEVKSELLKIPYKKVDPASIPPDLLSLIPQETSRAYRVIPIERRKELLIVGMLRPDDVRAQEALRFIAKREGVSLGVYVVTPTDLALVWRRYAPYRTEVESAVKDIGTTKRRDDLLVTLEEGAQTAEDAPIIKIVASTLREAVELKASDVHIEPQRSRLRIRFRVDGDLEEAASLPSGLNQPIVSRVKVLARLRLDETRVPQDGRFRAVIAGRDIDFRVATFPTPNGEKVAIRVLDPTTGLKGLKELGLNEYNFQLLENAAEAPFGMILITGPTGSGKSTTLYAIMQRLNSDKVNILTLEDPVEYFMDGINQSQVKPEIGYDFSSGLRQILRQDPDIIMVGEIRDSETASLAVNAALTGHLMLSTLHTNNAVGVIPRLVDLGVPTFLLSSALNLMLAQRLVSRLCPDCKKFTTPSEELQKIIKSELEILPANLKATIKGKAPYSAYKVGNDPNCKTCKGKGTSGRVAIFEIFKMTRELSDVVSKGFTEGAIADEAKRQGMVTLRQDGILKALAGEVILEEVLRETE
ncbi:MAG: GspE/PulE family protein [Minisyncoccia bacterium]|jgi:type IV pilus assembly protein PilB